MDLTIFFQKLFGCVLNIKTIIIFAILIIIYHVLVFLFRDRKYIKILKKNKDPESITIKNFDNLPLVNILVPACKCSIWDIV